MPGQTARDRSAADELVGKERMDVKDRIYLGYGHIRPAEAERGHSRSIAPSTNRAFWLGDTAPLRHCYPPQATERQGDKVSNDIRN
jgi:hypothetical protein